MDRECASCRIREQLFPVEHLVVGRLRPPYQETYCALKAHLQAGKTPREADLAKELSFTRRTIQLHLQRLESIGALVVTRQRNGRNAYELPLLQQKGA